MTKDIFILDSYAFIAYIEKEAGYQKVVELLKDGEKGSIRILLNLINWGEIYYSAFRLRGEQKAEETLLLIDQLPIELISVDRDFIYQAARLKAQYRIAFGDCFAAALTIREQGCLLTGDKEFKKMGEKMRIKWLP